MQYCLKTDSERIHILEEVKNVIDENWDKFTSWRETNEISTLCRFIEKEGDTISIATDVTYKDIVGLRWPKLHSLDKTPFQVVTALALVKTADNYLVLIPRDSGDWEPSLECSGGFIRSKYFDADKISVDEFIQKRVCEDLQLEPTQISGCTYLDSYNAKNILEYMLIYEVKITLSKNELLETRPSFLTLPGNYTPITYANTTSILHPPSAGAILSLK